MAYTLGLWILISPAIVVLIIAIFWPRMGKTTRLVVGGAFIFVVLGAVGLLSLEIARGPTPAYRTECMNNLRQIGLAMMQYAGENEGRFPESFGVLLKENYLITAKVFLCPSTEKRLPPEGFPVPDEKTHFSGYDLDVLRTVDDWADYVVVKGVKPDAPGDWILIHDKSAENHKGEGRNCWFVDGHVKWTLEEDFQERMSRQREEMARPPEPQTDSEHVTKKSLE